MNIQHAKLDEIFYIIDEFCKEFNKTTNSSALPQNTDKAKRNKPSKLSKSEVITILILFHTGNYRNLKHFYLFYVCQHMQSDFPKQVSYNRFVELQQKAMLPLALFLKTVCLAKCTGI